MLTNPNNFLFNRDVVLSESNKLEVIKELCVKHGLILLPIFDRDDIIDLLECLCNLYYHLFWCSYSVYDFIINILASICPKYCEGSALPSFTSFLPFLITSLPLFFPHHPPRKQTFELVFLDVCGPRVITIAHMGLKVKVKVKVKVVARHAAWRAAESSVRGRVNAVGLTSILNQGQYSFPYSVRDSPEQQVRDGRADNVAIITANSFPAQF